MSQKESWKKLWAAQKICWRCRTIIPLQLSRATTIIIVFIIYKYTRLASNSRFTNDCLNKYEYTSKTVKRTNKKITTYWTHNFITLSQTNCILKQPRKTRKGQKFVKFFQNFTCLHGGCPTGPSNGNSFKSQSEVWSINYDVYIGSCHCLLTNEFTLWDLKKKWSLLEPCGIPHGDKTSQTFVRFLSFPAVLIKIQFVAR